MMMIADVVLGGFHLERGICKIEGHQHGFTKLNT